ncbi:hypothetical protein EDB86DRAFT_3078742 [Lactarius hatsudake]|nr:hypothetical protein EDB86DRAFT_3078742 [Lactarius hatsudake]
MAVIFPPSKRLQTVQVLSFARYGIKAIAINEDVPNDPVPWKGICDAEYSVLPEQFWKTTRVTSLDLHVWLQRTDNF